MLTQPLAANKIAAYSIQQPICFCVMRAFQRCFWYPCQIQLKFVHAAWVKIKGLVYVRVWICWGVHNVQHQAFVIDATLDDNSIKRPDSINRSVLNPLYRGTWFPTRSQMWLCPRVAQRFHPLYRGTWFPTDVFGNPLRGVVVGFHPLYRGTWFPT